MLKFFRGKEIKWKLALFFSVWTVSMLYITFVNPTGNLLLVVLQLLAIFGTMGCAIWLVVNES